MRHPDQPPPRAYPPDLSGVVPARRGRRPTLAALTCLALLGGSAVPAAAAAAEDDDTRVPAKVERELTADGEATFWVVLDDRAELSAAARQADWADRGRAVVQELQRTAAAGQRSVLDVASRYGAEATSYWIANAVEVTGDRAALRALLDHDDVAEIVAPVSYAVPEPVATAPAQAGPAGESDVEWNVEMVRAPEVWSQYGTRGEGIVVASLDTGVDVSHPALRSSYRGHNLDGSLSHEYHFFDPTGVCATSTTPCDNNGHGTHTTGTMVGSDPRAGQPHTGVAPGARWIAAKGCDSRLCADADLLAAAQWLLAPTDANGRNPRPDLRPHIINNSWGGDPTNFFLQETVRAWVAAGIFPVFAAGNLGGPWWCDSAAMPGGLVESYAVGAVDRDGQIAEFSSRGPSVEGETKPDISAPGVDVNSAIPGGGYAPANGTSMAAPHVAAAVALLWSASDTVIRDIDETRALLDRTAIDRDDTTCGGTAGDNNVYGEGLLDALALLSAAEIAPTGQVEGAVSSTAPLPGGAQLRFTGPVERVVVTDADGGYRTRLPEGDYQVTAGAFGHETVGQTVSVATDQATRLDLTLPALPRHTVRGTVLDTSGAPLPSSPCRFPVPRSPR